MDRDKLKTLNVDVVGIHHRVTTMTQRKLAEHVLVAPIPVILRRDPKNSHDRNAIEVVLDGSPMKGMMIGFIPKGVAAEMAPQLDKGTMVVKGVMLTRIHVDDGDGELVVKWKRPASKPKTAKRKTS